jgi:AraC-like DNA-binding protein
MKLNLPEIICLYTSILLFLLGFIFAFYPKGNKNSNMILAAFMFCNAILLGRLFVSFFYPAFNDQFVLISAFGQFSYILLPPLLYLYIASLNSTNFKFKTGSLLHFLSFTLFICAIACSNYLSSLFNFNLSIANSLIIKIYKVTLHFVIGSYLFFSFRMVSEDRKNTGTLSLSKPVIDYSWVNVILYCFVFMWLLDLTVIIINGFSFNLPQLTYSIFILSLFVNFLFCMILVYKGINLSKTSWGISELPKYTNYSLRLDDYQEILKRLLDYMNKEKPYLQPAMTLEELARLIQVPYKLLSQTIHICLNQSFSDFINTYRINEAKRYLASDPENKRTILDILFSSGFNTKSVFNKTFKEKTGLTPREYKKTLKALPD